MLVTIKQKMVMTLVLKAMKKVLMMLMMMLVKLMKMRTALIMRLDVFPVVVVVVRTDQTHTYNAASTSSFACLL
jgi:hypothetical protein